LVEAMKGDFDASRYHDEYREALMGVIEAKIDGQPVERPQPVVETSKLTDLMAVLEASVAAARQGRGTDATTADGAEEKAAAKAPARRARSTAAKEPTSVAEVRKSRAAKPAAKPAARSTAAKTVTAKAAGRAAAGKAEPRTERKRKSA
ncbi:MAG: Ku protein, partial [Chloroflexota bacterium]|nr:Ku protein [Chloroflexota bacterium]